MKEANHTIKLLPVALLILFIFGCQGVFTLAPFGFLADDPAKMSHDQLITYGWDVIASGDTAKMTAALAAVGTAFTANPLDKDICYLGANLCLKLSNAATLFTSPPTDAPGVTAYRASIDIPMIEAAGGFYAAALINGASLNATDYIFATIGLLLPTTADNLDQLTLMNYIGPPNPPPATPITPAQTLILNTFYNNGILLLGGPGNPWDILIRVIFFPFAP